MLSAVSTLSWAILPNVRIALSLGILGRVGRKKSRQPDLRGLGFVLGRHAPHRIGDGAIDEFSRHRRLRRTLRAPVPAPTESRKQVSGVIAGERRPSGWRRAAPEQSDRSAIRAGRNWDGCVEIVCETYRIVVLAELRQPGRSRAAFRRLDVQAKLSVAACHAAAWANFATARACDAWSSIDKLLAWRRSSSAIIGGWVRMVETTLTRRPLRCSRFDEAAEIAAAEKITMW